MTLTDCLSELLASSDLRSRFRADALGTARTLTDNERDVQVLAAIDARELDVQSRKLIRKRYAEVFALVPMSSRNRFEQFQQYADTFWPQGHRRRYIDVARFLAWLGKTGETVCRLEQARFLTSAFWIRSGWIYTVRGWRIGIVIRLLGSVRAVTAG